MYMYVPQVEKPDPGGFKHFKIYLVSQDRGEGFFRMVVLPDGNRMTMDAA